MQDSVARPLDPLRRMACTTAMIVVAVAGVVLVGWVFDVTLLKQINPNWASMKANTALCFAMGGGSAWMFARYPGAAPTIARRLRVVLASASGAIALATLGEYMLGASFGIDEFLFKDAAAPVGTSNPGRMAPYTASSFTVMSAALLVLVHPRPSPARDLALVVPIFAISLLSLASYMFGVPAQQQFLGFTGLALHTAVCFSLIAVSILAGRGDDGALGIFRDATTGGVIARRLLPWVIIVPLLIAWIRLAGERAGFYGTSFGLALYAVTNVLFLVVLVWHSARSIGSAERARHDTARQLSSTEKRYRAMIERSPAGITLLTRDATPIYRSPASWRLLGIEPPASDDEVPAPAQIHPDDSAAARATVASVAERPGASGQTQTRVMHGDGTWHWIEATFTNLLDDPDVGAIVSNAHDITERVESERAVHESDERFREIAEHIQEAFFSIDIATRRTLYVSPTWSVIWGRPIDEAYNNPNVWFDAIHADDQPALKRSQQRAALGEVNSTDFRVIRPDQTTRWVRGRVFPVRNAAGQIHRLVGVSADITELRDAEARFTQAQKMEAVGQLAGGVAHDFNNLLTIILVEAEMAQEDVPGDSEVHRLLADIRKAGESAVVLTRQLLAFSRKQLIEPVVFDFNDAVGDTVKMLRRLIGEDVRIELSLSTHAGSIRADRGQFEQVLTNLAVNARDAMPGGGLLAIATSVVELDAEYAARHSEVQPGDYALVSVSDTGSGMSAEVIARAFEPFFTTKERGKGTGLGLATCFGIVKQAGGHISVYSEPGKGTTFRVYFPRVVEDAVAAPDSAEVAPRGTETILLVEDDAGVRRVGVALLRGQGYTVIAARDGLEAIKLLEAHAEPIHMLLSDVVLPGMGGRELSQRIVALRPGIKVLFTSGYTDDVILQHQLLSHDVTVLQKPYTRSSLSAKVREVLDRKPA